MKVLKLIPRGRFSLGSKVTVGSCDLKKFELSHGVAHTAAESLKSKQKDGFLVWLMRVTCHDLPQATNPPLKNSLSCNQVCCDSC